MIFLEPISGCTLGVEFYEHEELTKKFMAIDLLFWRLIVIFGAGEM